MNCCLLMSRTPNPVLVRLAVEWGADPSRALAEAARLGHEGVVRLLHRLDPIADVNEAMKKAAEAGHLQIVRLCHKWGADRVNEAMMAAASNGHTAIMQACRDEWDAPRINEAISYAAVNSRIEAVRYCLEEWDGTTDMHLLPPLLASVGAVECLRLCRRWIEAKAKNAAPGAAGGLARHWYRAWASHCANEALKSAAAAGRAEVARICHDEWGATDADGALAAAARGHVFWRGPSREYAELMRLCYDWGASSVECLDSALSEAARVGEEAVPRVGRGRPRPGAGERGERRARGGDAAEPRVGRGRHRPGAGGRGERRARETGEAVPRVGRGRRGPGAGERGRRRAHRDRAAVPRRVGSNRHRRRVKRPPKPRPTKTTNNYSEPLGDVRPIMQTNHFSPKDQDRLPPKLNQIHIAITPQQNGRSQFT